VIFPLLIPLQFCWVAKKQQSWAGVKGVVLLEKLRDGRPLLGEHLDRLICAKQLLMVLIAVLLATDSLQQRCLGQLALETDLATQRDTAINEVRPTFSVAIYFFLAPTVGWREGAHGANFVCALRAGRKPTSAIPKAIPQVLNQKKLRIRQLKEQRIL
jgi:hypothetical protein